MNVLTGGRTERKSPTTSVISIRGVVGAALLLCALTASATSSNVTGPASGTTVRPGNNVALSGNAKGTIVIQNGEDRAYGLSRVEIRRNGTLIGNATLSAPADADTPTYTWTYTDNVSTAGTYVYSSLAYDTGSHPQSGTSSTVSITEAANVAPSVTLTPTDGSTVTGVPQTITVTAGATDSDGSIASLTLSANGSSLKQCTGATCSANWTASGPGSVTFAATATDNEGATTTVQSVVTFATGNAAQYVSQSVPATMTPGQVYSTSVTFKNVGQSTWAGGGAYHIGTYNPYDASYWSTSRMNMPQSVAPGATVTFPITITAPTSNGTYNYQWRLIQENVEWFDASSPATQVTVAAANAASFASQSVPASMSAGQVYPVSVTMTNTGSNTWAAGSTFYLGSANPQGNSTWSLSRVNLASAVAPGQAATFSFNVTAPTTTGSYNFQWQMAQDGVGSFGAISTNVAVTVTTGNSAAFSSQTVPSTMNSGQVVPVHVVLTNNGTTTWTTAASYGLSPQNPGDASVWGVAKAALPASVPPGQSVDIAFNVTAPAAAGTYNFEWRMIQAGVESFGASSPKVAVTVGAPQPVTIVPPNLSGALAGHIDAVASVSSSGAASYSVPVQVPPGTAGMAPALSLNYASQGEDGILGVGWTMGGLSEITRCKRTYAQDGYAGAVLFDANDRFCLDGQRLVLINGTYGADGAEYRTELDSFARIISHTSTAAAGPASFTVYEKNGQIRSYGTDGTTFGSTMIAQGTSPAVNLKWALGRVEDRHGNFMTMGYTQNTSTGEFYPSLIRYTGNSVTGQQPFNAVRLVYGSRPDSIVKYLAGAQMLIAQRVTNVQTVVNTDASGNGGTLVRDYRLAYTTNPQTNRNLVSSITLCDTNGTCLPATQLTWQGRTSTDDSFTASAWGGPAASSVTAANLTNKFLRGDFNGDGKQDLLITDGAGNFSVCVSTGTSFDCQQWTGPVATIDKILIGDFNGDGKSDLLVPPQDGSTSGQAAYTICLANPAARSFDCQSWNATTAGPGIGPYFIADMNGDGLDDLVVVTGTVCYSTGVQGTGFNCVPYADLDDVFNNDYEATYRWAVNTGEINGDGKADFFRSHYGYQGVLNGDTGFTLDSSPVAGLGNAIAGVYGTYPIIGDHNNDGYSDLVGIYATTDSGGNQSNWAANLCRGTGKAFVCRNWSIDSSFFKIFFVGDMDSDGVPDFVQPVTGGFRVCRMSLDASQNNVVNCSIWSTPDTSSFVGYFVGDFTGKGRTDIAYYAANGQWTVMSAGGNNVDLLTAVVDGVGNRTEFSYKSTSDASVYTMGTGATYPQRDVQPALQVVSEIRRDNGLGGWLTSDYRYATSRTDLRGRGSLGFGAIDEVDAVSQVTSHSEFAQTFPFTGMPTKATSTHASGIVLSSQTMTLASTTTANSSIFFPYVATSSQTTIDLNGAPLLTSTVQIPSNGYDAYGNLLSGTTTVTAGASSVATTATNTFDNLVSSWLIGLPRQTQVTKSTNGQAVTRTATIDYDTLGTVAHTAIEPTNAALTLGTTYTRDSFGNVTQKTIAWTDPATATARQRNDERSTFDAKGRFATQVTNALNQSETRVYTDAYGQLSSLTGPNGITTTWQHDGFGRKTVESRADGTTTSWAYRQCVDACQLGSASVVVRQQASGSTQVSVPGESFADRLDRMVQTRTWGFTGSAIFSQRSYDTLGRLQSASRPYAAGASGVVTSYVYDDLGRNTSIVEPSSSGGTRTSTIIYNGLSLTTQNAKGATRTTTRNAFGSAATVVDEGGYTTSYVYDPFGNLLRTTDVKGNQINVAYDNLGRKTQLNDPDLGITNFSVNPLGQTWKQIDAKNQTATFTFDDLNRLTHRLEPDLDSYWIYDTATKGIGKLAEAYTLKGDGTKDYRRVHAYDALSRPASTTITLDQDYVTSWSYDGLGRPFTAAYTRNATGGSGGPSIGLTSVYNGYGYLAQLQSNRTGGRTEWSVLGQDAEQRVTREQLGDGRYTDRRFNAYTGTLDGLSAGVDNGSGGDDTSLENETYSYDELNRMTYRAQRKPDASLLQETFTYDALNRLTASQVSGLAQKTYGYDEIGNLTAKTGLGSYAYPASGAGSVRPHAVASITGSVAGQTNPAFAYDGNGNQTSGASRTLSWTSFDMPASITRALTVGTGSTNTATFTYGPEHQRARQTVTGSNPITIYYAGSIEKEVTGSNTTIKTRLPNGIGYIEESTATPTPRGRYVRGDHLGSSVVMTDESGTVLDKLSYDSWGQRRNTDGSDDATFATKGVDRIGYTDEEMLDTIGLVHLNGRVYDPLVGKFVSADPTIPYLNDSQSLNRYAYVRNNPLNAIDPSGFLPEPQIGDRVEVYCYSCRDKVRAIAAFIDALQKELARSRRQDRMTGRNGSFAGFGETTSGQIFESSTSELKVTDILKLVCANPLACAIQIFLTPSNIFQENTADDDLSKHHEREDERANSLDKPAGVPDNWREEPTRGDGGRQWVNPDNPGDRIRVMPGDPDSPNLGQREPYVRDVRNGNQWLDVNGNRIEGKTGKNSPDTHIPVNDYVFRP